MQTAATVRDVHNVSSWKESRRSCSHTTQEDRSVHMVTTRRSNRQRKPLGELEENVCETNKSIDATCTSPPTKDQQGLVDEATILRIMREQSKDPRVQRDGCYALWLSSIDYFSKGVPKDLDLVHAAVTVVETIHAFPPVADIVQNAFKFLDNLMTVQPNTIHAVEKAEGVNAIICAMDENRESSSVQESGCFALRLLFNASTDVQTRCFEAVVSAMDTHQESLETQIAAVSFLAEFSRDGNEMHNFSRNQSIAIGLLVSGMKTHASDGEMQRIGCLHLYRLAENPETSSDVPTREATDVVVQAMTLHPTQKELHYWGLGTFQELLARDEGYDTMDETDYNLLRVNAPPTNAEIMADAGCIQCIAEAMQRFPGSAKIQGRGCSFLATFVERGRWARDLIGQHCIEAILSAMGMLLKNLEIQKSGCKVLNFLCRLERDMGFAKIIAKANGDVIIHKVRGEHCDDDEIMQFAPQVNMILASVDD